MSVSWEVRERRPRDTGAAGRRRALFEEALRQIELSYDDDQLTVDGLSQKIFTSRRQLQRAFAESGTSVQERLYALRMERAAELLQASALSVAEVAHSVGYRQPPQFAKAFRRYYRLSPSQWRNSGDPNPTIGEVNPWIASVDARPLPPRRLPRHSRRGPSPTSRSATSTATTSERKSSTRRPELSL